MMIPVKDILATLRHHRLTVTMIVLQVALTCVVVSNASSIIGHRLDQMGIPSGVAEDQLVVLSSTSVDKSENHQTRHAEDLAALREIPGVISVAGLNSVPLGTSDETYAVCPTLEALQRAIAAGSLQGSECLLASRYDTTPGALQTLGLRLASGQDFAPDSYSVNQASQAIITTSLAQRVFHGASPIGKTMYQGDHMVTVVGTVDHLLRPRLEAGGENELSMLFPVLPDASRITYVIRTQPQARDNVLTSAVARLRERAPGRLIKPSDVRTYEALRDEYFRHDETMVTELGSAGFALLCVTGVGIAGLASFWVQQRRRTIGVRRALGATRADILRYFQIENLLIVGGGVLLGIALSVAAGIYLTMTFAQPALSAVQVVGTALGVMALGQLAVLGPALKASAVPPIVASRGR
jgi:putative ABC transport system permease protein